MIEPMLIVDSNRGIYQGEYLAEYLLTCDNVTNKEEILDDLMYLKDFQNEFYPEVWSDVMDKAEIKIGDDEMILATSQCGDIFLVSPDDPNFFGD